MLGSTFIAEAETSKLICIKSFDDVRAFAHVDLDRMTTIDVAPVLTAAGVKWTDGQPVRFDDLAGVALCKVSDGGLDYLLRHPTSFPPDCQADIQKLSAFVRKHGTSTIYEYATF